MADPKEQAIAEELNPKSQKMEDIEKSLDDAAQVPEPKQKTPEEMRENPMAVLEDDADGGDTAGDAGSDTAKPKGEGSGDHPYGINDNDSKNGPLK